MDRSHTVVNERVETNRRVLSTTYQRTYQTVWPATTYDARMLTADAMEAMLCIMT